MENDMIKDLVLFAVIIIIAAVVASFIFAPADEAQGITNIDILNKGNFGDNSTLYIKLTDIDKAGLSNKTMHVKVLDANGTAVYTTDVKTHATGVAMAKLTNVSAGEYTLNITFDGDQNYTGSSISKKITVEAGVVEDTVENSTLITQTIQEAQDAGEDTSVYTSQSTSNTPTYTPSSSSSDSSSSSSSSSSDYNTYDENGNEVLPEYDEDGRQVDST